jgi:WD repeat-containing protein 19
LVPSSASDITYTRRPLQERVEKLVSYHRFSDAYSLAVSFEAPAHVYSSIAEKALYCADVETALLCYRECKEKASTVFALERLRDIEEMKLLSGHIFLLKNDYERAEQCFLSSSRFDRSL